MRFVCPMWHPNIHEDGRVSIPILQAQSEDLMSGESSGERWKPELGVTPILISIMSMMNNPYSHSPFNTEANR